MNRMDMPGHAVWLSLAALAAVIAAPVPANAATSGSVKVNVGKDAIKPDVSQTAAIQRAAAADIKEFIHPEQGGYDVALADLNDDGRADLLVQYSDISFCGSSGCSGAIVMATANGYAPQGIDLPNFYGEIDILPGKHGGMHDLRFNGDSPVWTWDGSAYQVSK